MFPGGVEQELMMLHFKVTRGLGNSTFAKDNILIAKRKGADGN